MDPPPRNHHIPGSQLVLGITYGEHCRLLAEVQLNLIGIEFCSIGEDDGFVQNLRCFDPDANGEGGEGHRSCWMNTPKDLSGAHGEQNCCFIA